MRGRAFSPALLILALAAPAAAAQYSEDPDKGNTADTVVG